MCRFVIRDNTDLFFGVVHGTFYFRENISKLRGDLISGRCNKTLQRLQNSDFRLPFAFFQDCLEDIEDQFLKSGWTEDTFERQAIQSIAWSDTPRSGKTWRAEQVGVQQIPNSFILTRFWADVGFRSEKRREEVR